MSESGNQTHAKSLKKNMQRGMTKNPKKKLQ
jgi:hypothetical protein